MGDPADKSGGASDDKSASKGADEAATKVLQAELDKVKTELKTTSDAKGDVDRRLTELSEALSDPKYLAFLAKDAGDDRGGKQDETVNLDEMSTKQLAEYILTKVGDQIKGLGSSVDEKFKSFGGAIALDRMKQRVDAVVRKYPDFWEHKETMHKISLAVPDIDPETAYHAAKMKALEDKAAKEKEDATPSGDKGTSPVDALHAKKDGYSKEEAVDAAFKVAFGEKKE